MKKILAFALAVMLVVLCCACGNNETKDPVTGSKPSSTDNSTVSDTDSTASDEETSSKKDTADKNGSVAVSDTLYESYIVDEDTVVEFEGAAKGGFYTTDNNAWEGTALKTTAHSDAQAKAMRDAIIKTPNTMEIYGSKVTGKIYYVSPDGNDENDGLTPQTAIKTLDAEQFLLNNFEPGDAVLFERGGIWRVTNKFKTRAGVVYGSYGEGPKPAFYGSPYNYADESFWSPSNRENIWKVTFADSDAGLLVFNHGEGVGVKKLNGLVALEKNFDYYFNANEDTVYIYYDGGNPGKVFKDIEIGLNMPIFDVSRQENVTIDNITFKYSARFGIDLAGCDGSVITNCELGFIGGAIQSGTVRLGNAIQTWNGVKNQVISNNWVYQIYDTGITWQGDNKYKTAHMSDVYENITYEKNLVEYCSMSFEFWHANNEYDDNGNVTYKHDYQTRAKVTNFKLINNLSRLPGWGWGVQRPDLNGTHVMFYQHIFPNAKGNVISGNIFDSSYYLYIQWAMPSGAVARKENGEWDISGNYWYQQPSKNSTGMRYDGTYLYGTNQDSLNTAVTRFDTNPAEVLWFE
jgi:hypothetical protein